MGRARGLMSKTEILVLTLILIVVYCIGTASALDIRDLTKKEG